MVAPYQMGYPSGSIYSYHVLVELKGRVIGKHLGNEISLAPNEPHWHKHDLNVFGPLGVR